MRPSPFQAYVRIMIGCDKFCTYCIVPSVRGPEQSRPPEHIAAEVRQLAAEGCKEITLLGQTVNSYQLRPRRRPPASGCPTCWLRIHDTPGIERIKFITNFPRDMSDDLLDAVRDAAEGLPVSARAGPVGLQRRAEADETALHRRILSRHAGPLPGEGAGRGHQQRLHRRLLRRDGGVVPAHLRPGARGRLQEQLHLQVQPAARAPRPTSCIADDVPEEVKKRRNNDLLAIQNAVSLADHRGRVGDTVEVLVEGPSKTALKHEAEPGATAADGPDDDGPHRRLRRQRAADRADGAGAHRGGDGVHAVRHGGDGRTGRRRGGEVRRIARR